jgi:hypothetical protein
MPANKAYTRPTCIPQGHHADREPALEIEKRKKPLKILELVGVTWTIVGGFLSWGRAGGQECEP